MDGDLAPARTALLDRLLEEAAQIGEAARDRLRAPDGDRAPLARLKAHHEVGVIATCLGFSVAWLIEQKAYVVGELAAPPSTAVADHAAAPEADPAIVGAELAEIGRRARDFGLRVHRLAAH